LRLKSSFRDFQPRIDAENADSIFKTWRLGGKFYLSPKTPGLMILLGGRNHFNLRCLSAEISGVTSRCGEAGNS